MLFNSEQLWKEKFQEVFNKPQHGKPRCELALRISRLRAGFARTCRAFLFAANVNHGPRMLPAIRPVRRVTICRYRRLAQPSARVIFAFVFAHLLSPIRSFWPGRGAKRPCRRTTVSIARQTPGSKRRTSSGLCYGRSGKRSLSLLGAV
jgi:hypothetical protein